MVWWWWVIPGAVAVIGLAFLLSGLGWMFRGRPVKGGRGVIFGAVPLAVAAIVALMGLNLQTYQRLALDRQWVGTLLFQETGENTYRMVFTSPVGEQTIACDAPAREGEARPFEDVRGDQWLMRARVIRWKPWATVLGLNAQYRLDSIDGTWEDQQVRRTVLPTVVDLRPVRRTGVDFLPTAQFVSRYAPLIDVSSGPVAGEAAFWPMADGAQYKVCLTAQGDLRVEAENAAAVDAVNEWMERQAQD
jgi:hypothetical protein